MAKSSDPQEARVQRWTVTPKTTQEKYLIFFCTVWTALILLLDQLSKIAVERFMEYGQSIALIDGLFHLTYVTNKGAAWGMLAGYGWLLLLIGVAVLAAVVYFLRYLTEGYVERYIAIFTIAGGVIGNSIDRMWRGAVVDYFDVFYSTYHWPVFNVADCAICVGVGIFLLSALLRPQKRVDAAQ